ncbi:DUF3397 domain-containing protein [Paenibacillus sp. 481]|uniref:DUF3397 domain-containing protein n=1 Tax=Paenibacillus sp. 481 TaxID=2835869 RepID=UPI001E387946|nr:DUF3397 domain-containing protein [Paenibacillus sp. 481]UHA74136.1 DUF3397 domain-containing protein [Paenibacillus sp. 481]
MWQLLSNSFVLFSVLPFFPFIIAWFIASYFVRPRKKAFMVAMDVTTAFLIASVSGLYNVIFNSQLGLYWFLLLLLVSGGLLGSLQQRKYGKVDMPKLLRTIWRISFFAFTVLYLVLMPIGVIKYISTM